MHYIEYCDTVIYMYQIDDFNMCCLSRDHQREKHGCTRWNPNSEPELFVMYVVAGENNAMISSLGLNVPNDGVSLGVFCHLPLLSMKNVSHTNLNRETETTAAARLLTSCILTQCL